jgi:hypothetical protein
MCAENTIGFESLLNAAVKLLYVTFERFQSTQLHAEKKPMVLLDGSLERKRELPGFLAQTSFGQGCHCRAIWRVHAHSAGHPDIPASGINCRDLSRLGSLWCLLIVLLHRR